MKRKGNGHEPPPSKTDKLRNELAAERRLLKKLQADVARGANAHAAITRSHARITEILAEIDKEG